jgi:hypothetical protein
MRQMAGASARQGEALRKAVQDATHALFAAIDKGAADRDAALRAQWEQALQAFRQDGSATGAAAMKAVQQLGEQARAAMRDGRAFGQSAVRALLDHYAALASGVLIGMSSAMAGGTTTAAAAAPRPSAKS